MKINEGRIKSLQMILKELGLEYTDEQAQEAGIAIMRFVLVKAKRRIIVTNNDMEI